MGNDGNEDTKPEPKEPFRFTVSRGRWNRGGDGLLFDSARGFCCLGFLAVACGYTETDIEAVGLPHEVCQYEADGKRWPSGLLRLSSDGNYDDGPFKGTRECDKIVSANDDGKIDDTRRENTLTALFAGIGIEVTFVD